MTRLLSRWTRFPVEFAQGSLHCPPPPFPATLTTGFALRARDKDIMNVWKLKAHACIGAGYLIALNCVASVAEWSRRLSVAQEITGSNPVARPKNGSEQSGPRLLHLPAPVAQWIEHWASDPGVAGSSPAGRATSLLLPFKATAQHVRKLTLWRQHQGAS